MKRARLYIVKVRILDTTGFSKLDGKIMTVHCGHVTVAKCFDKTNHHDNLQYRAARANYKTVL